MNQRKVLIIDDEPNSRELLSLLLTQYVPGVQLLGTAPSAKLGIHLIHTIQPDLVFLDIELAGGDGFQVLDAFESPAFEVVFTSGYHPEILQGLNYAAIPFLTKPIVLQELQALMKSLKQLPVQPDQVQMVKGYQQGSEKDSLFVSGRNAYHRIAFKHISFIEAQRAYARIVLTDGGEHYSAHPLSHFEGLLPNNLFFRTHRSYLVNLSLVSSYDPGRTGSVHLIDGQSLPIAARRKTHFIQKMKDRPA